MFDEFMKHAHALWTDMEAGEIDAAIREMNIPEISIFDHFGMEKRHGFKIDPENSDRLRSCIGKALKGIETLDDLIRIAKDSRGMLVRRVLKMRNSFSPKEGREFVRRLDGMARENENTQKLGKERQEEAKRLLAGALGLDSLPDAIVNLDVFKGTGYSEGTVSVLFGVAGRPTKVIVSFPCEVDYASDYSIPKEIEEQERYPYEILAHDADVDMSLIVKLGASAEGGTSYVNTSDTVSLKFTNVKDLASEIMKIVRIDVRDSIRNVVSILDVKNLDDFVNWRGMRAANAEAVTNEDKSHGD